MSDTDLDPLQGIHAEMAELERQTLENRANGKPTPDAWRAQLADELAAAEKELARDQKALEAAIAKVDALKADVAFDEMKVASRRKGLGEFERLMGKAAK